MTKKNNLLKYWPKNITLPVLYKDADLVPRITSKHFWNSASEEKENISDPINKFNIREICQKYENEQALFLIFLYEKYSIDTLSSYLFLRDLLSKNYYEQKLSLRELMKNKNEKYLFTLLSKKLKILDLKQDLKLQNFLNITKSSTKSVNQIKNDLEKLKNTKRRNSDFDFFKKYCITNLFCKKFDNRYNNYDYNGPCPSGDIMFPMTSLIIKKKSLLAVS